jgi:hypothetical protein
MPLQSRWSPDTCLACLIYIHIYLYRNVILRYAYTKIYIYILDTVYFWVLQLAKWLPLRAMMWDLKALVRKPPSLTKLILPHIQAEIRPFDWNLHVLYLMVR